MSKSAKLMILAASLALIGALACSVAGCAPQAKDTARTQKDDSSNQVSFTWSESSDCAMCHDKETSSLENPSCLASTHQAEEATCATCHADTSGLESAHAEATPELAKKRATKLRTTVISKEACLSCHGGVEGHATATANSTVLTDSQGKTVNPHALPENEDHAGTDCSSCHDMHGSASAAESASAYCSSCHHSNVYECHTCHE